jgi:hypothetical protein
MNHDPSSSSETAAEMNGSAELNCRARQLGTGGLKAATAMMGGSLFLCGGKGKRKSRGNNCFALWALIAGAKGACCCVCVHASLRVCLVGEKLVKSYCSTFRFYLAKFLQPQTN